MLRATFLAVFWKRAVLYTRDNDRINITISLPFIDTRTSLVIYRPVRSVGNDQWRDKKFEKGRGHNFHIFSSVFFRQN